MKKHICSAIAFAVFATSAWASPATDMDLRVPFEFKAGTSTFPAGTYRVTEANSAYLLIRGEKGGVFVPKSAFILDTDESGRTTLKFNRAGDKYVLQAEPSQK